MARYAYLAVYSSSVGKAVIFAETKPGYFGYVNDTKTGARCDSTGNTLKAVCVPTLAGYYCSSWSGGSGYTKDSTTPSIIDYSSSNGSTAYGMIAGGSSVSGPSVTVIDNHGTHIGTPTGSAMKFRTGHAIGVKHVSTDSGWRFLGWKITKYSTATAAGTVLSTGGTTSGAVITFDAAYDAEYAVVFKLSTSSMYSVTIEALYEATVSNVTLSYDANGGTSTPAAQTVAAGTTVTLAAAISRPGYNFAGWKIGGSTYAAGSSYTVKNNVTAVAQWSQNVVYSVQFAKNATDVSGDAIPSIVVAKGAACILPGPELWERPDYSFVGWATSSTGAAAYQAGDSYTPTQDVTFFAVWGKTSGSGAQADYTSSQNTGGNGTVLDKTTDLSAYKFAVSSNVATETVPISYQSRLFGRWVEKRYSYSPDNNPNPIVTTNVIREQSETWNGTATIPRGSTVSTDGSANTSISIPGDSLSYYFYQRPNTSSVYYTTNETTRKTSTVSSWKWIAPELEHYDFDGWYTIDQAYQSPATITNAKFTIKIASEREITWGEISSKANYVRTMNISTGGSTTRYYTNYLQVRYIGKRYLVLFDANGGDLTDFYRFVRFGAAYGTMPTPSRPGYTFDGWYTAATGGTKVEASTVVNQGDHTLYAHWTKSSSTTETYVVVFLDTTGTNPETRLSFNVGASVRLPELTGGLGWMLPTGYTIANDKMWFDLAGNTYEDGAAVQDLAPSGGEILLQAAWVTRSYTVTFNPNGGTVGETSRSRQYGQQLGTLPTPTRDGYNFDGWFTAATGGIKIEATATVSADATYYAHWSEAAVDWWEIETW